MLLKLSLSQAEQAQLLSLPGLCLPSTWPLPAPIDVAQTLPFPGGASPVAFPPGPVFAIHMASACSFWLNRDQAER
jgi:hypothetical protein